MKELTDDGYHIIYMDECGFSTKTILNSDYSPLKTNHCIPMEMVNQPVYSLVLAISYENGVEHYEIFKKCIDENRFMSYLDDLSIANKHHKVALFMDNLSSHKTLKVRMKMQELGIEPIYSVPYFPDLNPTECCFSKIKGYYRRKKLNLLLNGKKMEMRDLVIESVNQLTIKDVQNFIKLSSKFLNK